MDTEMELCKALQVLDMSDFSSRGFCVELDDENVKFYTIEHGLVEMERIDEPTSLGKYYEILVDFYEFSAEPINRCEVWEDNGEAIVKTFASSSLTTFLVILSKPSTIQLKTPSKLLRFIRRRFQRWERDSCWLRIQIPGKNNGGLIPRFDYYERIKQLKGPYKKKISPQCPFCDKRFGNEMSLKKHFLKKHKEMVEFKQCLKCLKLPT
ncbi:hypothetical protein B9Z55_027655 [Caenorhabditis nigoni]|uniref:C2H2-type domain-containing protein n=1 Tax=Caenorhabditis nigoni TaxID=1611254 RepID=A0A2G5SF81_9PELO|nr:hypothetical protein B9Z55_027655 [Caenorhabditis nigoni]